MKISSFFSFILILTIILFSSCSKEQSNAKRNGIDKKSDHYLSDEAMELLKNRINNEGKSYMININEKISTYYIDDQGKRLNESDKKRLLASQCTGFSDAYVELVSFKSNYICFTGYKITWKYNVSSDNEIVSVNPSFPAQKSSGIIRTFNYGQIPPAYQQITYDVTITAKGPDLDYGWPYEKYEVEITSDIIPEDFIEGAMVTGMKLGANLAINCDNGTSPVSIAIDNYSLPTNTSGDACDRNDKVWIVPGGGEGGVGFTVTGVDPFYNCPSNYNYPDYQEVSYSVDSGSFQPIVNIVSSSPLHLTNLLRKGDIAYPPLLPSKGDTPYIYTFRYRNGYCSDTNKLYTEEIWEITY